MSAAQAGPGDDDEPGAVMSYHHRAAAWTVGQLRAALAAFPDELPLRVALPDLPGGPLADDHYVVTGTQRRITLGDEHAEPDGPVLVLEGDYPTGEYTR